MDFDTGDEAKIDRLSILHMNNLRKPRPRDSSLLCCDYSPAERANPLGIQEDRKTCVEDICAVHAWTSSPIWLLVSTYLAQQNRFPILRPQRIAPPRETKRGAFPAGAAEAAAAALESEVWHKDVSPCLG